MFENILFKKLSDFLVLEKLKYSHCKIFWKGLFLDIWQGEANKQNRNQCQVEQDSCYWQNTPFSSETISERVFNIQTVHFEI